jgi:predicted ATPase/DNA-binding SARP family transcriptional activator
MCSRLRHDCRVPVVEESRSSGQAPIWTAPSTRVDIPSSVVELQVLGPLRVVDGDRVIEIGPKERVVLARLAAAQGRVVPDDVLVDVLWLGRPPSSARKTLQGYVYRIRRAMGSSAIERTDTGYRLGDDVDVDIDVVESIVAEGRQAVADGRQDAAAELFKQAGELFRGDALRELDDDPSTAGLRRQFTELEMTVAEERLVNELEGDAHGNVVGELEALVGRDPTRERAWCLLVAALARSGRQADAFDAVARAKRALALELGIEPSPHLGELERAVLDQREPALLTGITTAATPKSTRQMPTAAVPSAGLPAWDTGFWGRSDEIAWLVDRIPKSRVVVLTGAGGIGKTRLAASVANELNGSFADGVYFVGLAGIVDDAVGHAIAAGVGVRQERQRSALDSLTAWIGGRHLLMVLDNCEEVIGPVRQAIETLVDSCPALHVLATCRRPLGVPGEVRVPVRPLDRSAALSLLIDRIKMSNAYLDTQVEDGPLDQLRQRLDGVPLALELAAAQCRTMTPAELLVRLTRRPDVLADRAGLFRVRHRDLDQIITWSWSQLSPVAQRVAARLTVVIGSFTLDAAEAIASDDDVDELHVVAALEELEDAGLMVREHIDSELRHRLLEPIRQVFTTSLDDAERATLAYRHAYWYSELAGKVKVGSVGAAFGRWADLVERELANFREAHRLLIDNGDADRAVAIVDGLAIIGAQRCLMELADWCDATVKLVEGRSDPLELAAVAAAVRFWWLQNRVTEVAEAATRMATAVGDPEHHLALERTATDVVVTPTTMPEAIQRLHDALKRHGSENPTWWTAQVGILLVLLGGLDDSSVAPMIEQFDSPVLSAQLTFARAVPLYLAGDFGAAAELARTAALRARAAGATLDLAVGLQAQGGWSARLADATTADVFAPLAESLELWDRLRVPWGRVLTVGEIAAALAVRGYPEAAFVLWGVCDACGIHDTEFGRPGVHPYIAHVPGEQTARWYNRGKAMTLDRAVAFARETVAAVLT